MYARTSTITGATNIDDGVIFVQEKVLPSARQQKGYGGLSISADRNLLTRSTGQAMVGTVWTDQAALAASEANVAARQKAAGERGVTFGEVSRRDILLADMP